MSSISETGHDENVANLEDLLSRCTGFGTAYNPTKNGIKLVSLQSLLTSGRNTLQAVKAAKTSWDNATNTREIAFKPLKTLCTRVVNALDSTDAAKQTVDDARTVNHKIQGVRAKATKGKKALDAFIDSTHETTAVNADSVAPVESVPEHKQISVSQQSYDSLIDNFTKLIQTVSSESLYIPNEADLKVTALNALLTNLKATNTAVINATTTLSNALVSRNTMLYHSATGLVDLALETKKYVKSVFGATSPQYKQVGSIQFRKYKV